MSSVRSTNKLFFLVLVLALACSVALAGCVVSSGSSRRGSRSCPRDKVWVKHKGKWKCKHRHHRRGHHKHHRHH